MNPNEPLSPQERELARLLAAGEPGPSAKVDAAILAAARAATSSPALAARPAPSAYSHRPRRRLRWTSSLGLAASVCLAIGLAWQLREPPRPTAADALPPAVPVPASAPSQAEAAIAAGQAPRVDEAPAPGLQMPAPSAVQPEPVPAPESVAEQTSRPAPRAAARAPATVAESAPVAAEALREADAELAQRSAPPPPPPPERAAGAAAPEAAVAVAAAPFAQGAAEPVRARELAVEADQAARPAAMRAASPAPARSAKAAGVGQDGVATGSQSDAAQWLEAIVRLQAQGDLAAARASLERFILAHPQHPIPEVLRPLLPADSP
jgi:hypothetical protein